MRNTNAYAERVQRVVDYLHDHLDDRFGLEKLAALANFSPYHFHRTYRGLLGETVYDTIRRLRLRRAALDLLDARLSIDRAATRAGYASQAEFTRAFRAEYGEPPARYRDLQAARDDKLEETNMYEVEIVDFAALRVAAIQHRGDYQLMSKAFEKLAAAAATKGFFTDQTRTIGIYHDDPKAVPASELRATACMTVPDDWSPSAELGEARIEGGRYARIVHTGPYTELEKPYDWLYRTWLPGSGEEPRDLPCIEEYLNDPRQVSARDLQTTVMMPLRDPRKAPKGKLPFIEMDGERIPDSELILEHLDRLTEGRLFGDLGSAERAQGTAFTRLAEDHLYWLLVSSRWLDDDWWPNARDEYFSALPRVPRALISRLARAGVRKALHGQGLGRHSLTEQVHFLVRGLEAISNAVGSAGFIAGSRMTVFDFGVAAQLSNMLDNRPPTWATPIAGARRLPDYAERVQQAIGVYAREPSGSGDDRSGVAAHSTLPAGI